MITFKHSSSELEHEKKKQTVICIIIAVLTILLISIFAIVQTRENSLIFFILMIVVGLVGSFFIMLILLLHLPTIRQLNYYALRNEISPSYEEGTFLRLEKRIVNHNIELQEVIFQVDDSEVCFYIEYRNIPNLTKNANYKIKHGNLLIFEIEEIVK